jgi:O-antigen ligase
MRVAFSQQRDPDRFKLFDLLLVVGLTLAPMTGLRVWRVGPAEILCLIWGLRPLLKRRMRWSDTLSFFVLFLVALAFGFVICSFVAPDETSIPGLLTWLYLAIISIGMYEGLSKRSLAYTEKLLRAFSVTAILWYMFLFLYSRLVSRTFLGAPLWYASYRFSGGGTNPHQIAVMMCGLCFVFTRQVLSRRKVLLNLLFTGFTIFLLTQTASSTGILAIFAGFVFTLYFFLINTFPKSRVAVAMVLTLALLLIGIFVYSTLYDRFMKWVASDSNGMGRLSLFAEFPESFVRSPILGLGPGTHGRGGAIEFHNTYLEIAAATGIAGFSVFLVYTVRIFKKTLRSDWRLFPILLAMYAYGLAGFAMRRLVYWGILIFSLVIAEKLLAIQRYGYEESTT